MRTYLWRLDHAGVYRVHNLDAFGQHNIIAVGPDHRELVRVSVRDRDEERRMAGMLRAWLEDPTQPLPPSALLGLWTPDRRRRAS